ncbi:hypothetical protein niasHT_008546 [Heterodera trifolii]|uniref:Uncharacterized protein n=1 Tax=Heterodera trifolii TaxID=157864 RepID=A0ABD2MD39_9BILA
MKIIAIIFFIFIFLHGKASGGGGEIPPNFQTEQSTETNDGQHQTGQYFAKINGQSYEIETPDIRVEVQMVKKHPLIVDSEKEEHLLINDEDRGVLPPGNHLDIEAPGCITNGDVGNRLITTKSGGTSCRSQVSDKPLPIMEAGDVDIITGHFQNPDHAQTTDARQQHIRYYADIDGRKYPTQGPDYDVLLYGTDLLVDGKLYKNAVPTGYVNYINRIEERIPILGSSGRSIPLSAAGDVQGNTARLLTNVVGQQISGSVSLPEIPIGGNSDYINTGHNKHDGKSTFGDTKREEKQKNKKKQQKRGKPMRGNFTNINDQANENIGGTQDIGGIQIGGMQAGEAIHFNTGGNRNVGGTQTIGGIQIGRMPTGATFGLNIGGNRNVGGTQGIGSTQGLYNRSNTGDLANALRQQRTEDNHISINGQIYSVDGPNVNVERNAQVKCGGSLSIDESPMGSVRIDCGGSLNINKSQMESSQIDVGGSIGIVESPMENIRLNCGGSLRIEKSKMETGNINCNGSTTIIESPAAEVNMSCGGSLSITKSKMETGNMNCGGSSTIVESPAQSVQLSCGGSLNMKDSPIKNVSIDCGGSATIKKSKMESGRINCGGSFSIDRTPTGSVRINYGTANSFHSTANSADEADRRHCSTDQQREVNGTTEGEAAEEAKDMTLALAMSRRQFWHQMTDEWNCKNGKLQKPKEEMFSKISYHEFVEFCESWKTKAKAVNSFVKSWQCKKGGKSGDGTTDKTPTKNDEMPLECDQIKPKFELVQHGGNNELLEISSTMEVLRAVYLGLFERDSEKSENRDKICE